MNGELSLEASGNTLEEPWQGGNSIAWFEHGLVDFSPNIDSKKRLGLSLSWGFTPIRHLTPYSGREHTYLIMAEHQTCRYISSVDEVLHRWPEREREKRGREEREREREKEREKERERKRDIYI